MTVRTYKPRKFSNPFEEEVFDQLENALERSAEEYILFGPVRIDTRELDGLVISDGYMVALEAKAVKGHVSMGVNTPVSVRTEGGEILDFKDRYEDPYEQADKQWRGLSTFIRNAFGVTDFWFKSMLVFEPGCTFDVPAAMQEPLSPYPLIVSLDQVPDCLEQLSARYNHRALSRDQQDAVIKAITQGPARLSEAEKNLFPAPVAPARAARPPDPPSTPLPRKPARAVDRTQFLPGVGPSLPPLGRKRWYRSPWFLWFAFLFLNPLWAFLMLGDKRQAWFVRLVATLFLLAELLVCLSGLYLVENNPELLDILGLPLAVPARSSTPGPLATVRPNTPTATVTPSPTPQPLSSPAEGACSLSWAESEADGLANKNRAMAWEETIRERVAGSGMTEKQFYAEVLERNPGLQADGYVFLAGKTYLLPRCE